VVLLLAQTLGVLRTYLRKSVAHFQRTHGRITEANYKAVETTKLNYPEGCMSPTDVKSTLTT